MVQIRFDTEALTSVRFGISPTIELVASVRCLSDPGGASLHLPWVARVRALVQELDLSTLHALQGSDIYNPDFIHPLPDGPLASFEREQATMLATPARQIRQEVLRAYENQQLPEILKPFTSEPREAVKRLAALMGDYWQRALAEDWERIKALLENDVLYRARQIADGGTRALFADLDPTISWENGVLRVEKTCEATDRWWNGMLDLDERGLLLVPSAFAWPKVLLVSAPPWQPTLIYPARGVGMLWDTVQESVPDALARLLGRNRAAVLLALDSPRSTSELAGLIGVTSGGVSQQLSVLADAGLVNRRRVQRHVLYLRTLEGDALVRAASAPA